MTATEIGKLVRKSAASEDKPEQREIRQKLVALPNNVYVVEQLF